MGDGGEDIIIDVVTNGHVLTPKEIPLAVLAEINATLAQGGAPKEIYHEGVGYLWLIRPCVYP